MNWKAVLFDLDGTLLDTLTDIGRAANHALERNEFPTHDLNAYRYFVGDGVRTLFRRVLPVDRSDDEIVNRCVAIFREEYAQAWNVETQPYVGIPELLDELTRRGVKLSILSNKPDEFTKRCAQHYLSAWQFEIVVGQRDGVPLKPDPTAARQIADVMGVSPEQFLYLGDTSVDMLTASRAGMFPVGALWGFRSLEELKAAGAQHLIQHPHQLLDLFN